MDWIEVLEDPTLQNLPFKIETNEWGQILMSPASNRHGHWQSRICAKLLSLMKGGDVISECSIQTTKGVRVADAAWGSPAFVARHGTATPYATAPEVCVEIHSPSNSPGEISEKVGLYFEAGAKEVWLCEDGSMTFVSPRGTLKRSKLFPKFPATLQ